MAVKAAGAFLGEGAWAGPHAGDERGSDRDGFEPGAPWDVPAVTKKEATCPSGLGVGS